MRTVLTGLAAALLALVAWIAPSAARDLKFITIDVAPWAWADGPTGRLMGVFPDVVRELERRTGNRIAMSLQPFARINRELEAAAQDCTIIVWIDSNERIVRKGELVSDHPMGVIARPGVTLKTYDDLKPLTIAVLRGAPTDPRFDNDTSLKKDYDTTDYGQGLAKIAHNRVDAVAGAMPTIQFLARQAGIPLGDQLQLGNIPLLLQCALKSPNLDQMPALNQAIRDMQQDGTMARILKENYFS
jgi:polar amino acid transport system substrate-binding protein